jgi:hypothetical protein
MRPQSEIRVAISAALMDGPGTVKALATRTGWSIRMVRAALNNMQTAGDAYVIQRPPGVRGRYAVYARAVRDTGPANESPFQSLIQAWACLKAA